jgi:hypothetical protein
MDYINYIFLILIIYIIYIIIYKSKNEYFESNKSKKLTKSKGSKKSKKLSINSKQTSEQLARSDIGTIRMQVEHTKIYPIGINFDAQFNNYNNLLSNTSLSLLNEIFMNTKYKANEKSTIINFNAGLKKIQNLYLTENDVVKYANYIINLMNSVSTMNNSFSFKKVNPVSKEQFENQIKLNFQIEILYNYPKSKNIKVEIVPDDFTLLINVVMLFEKNAYNTNQNTYLETLSLIGIDNYGFLAGYSKN